MRTNNYNNSVFLFIIATYVALTVISINNVSCSQDLYISVMGVDNANCGNQSHPCATFNYVFQEINKTGNKSIDYHFNLDDSVVYVEQGIYDVHELNILFDNLTIKAVGAVELRFTKDAGMSVQSNSFVIDGFQFSSTRETSTSGVSLSRPIFEFDVDDDDNEDNTAVFEIRNSVIEYLDFEGFVIIDGGDDTHVSFILTNAVISSSSSTFLFEVTNANLYVNNITVSNHKFSSTALQLYLTTQSFSLNNSRFEETTQNEIINIVYEDTSSTNSESFIISNFTVTQSKNKQNLLTFVSPQNISTFIIDDLLIEKVENVYFSVDANYLENAVFEDIDVHYCDNPTSNIRLDAVFELPNGHYHFDSIYFHDNTMMFSVVDVKASNYLSYFDIEDIVLSSNSFDSTIYYYNTEYPKGALFHINDASSVSIDHFNATHNTGIIQIIGITNANGISISNCYFEGNTLTNGLAHDIAIKGQRASNSVSFVNATITNSTFADPYPTIACYDANSDYQLTLQSNHFNNATHPYTSSINSQLSNICVIKCDTTESICGNEIPTSHVWVWILVAIASVIVIAGLGIFVAWRLREQKRLEYEAIEG